MAHSYSALCDEFYINMRLGTQMKLAMDRATIIPFFERIQRLYPNMVNFHQDQKHGESCIEETREGNTYRWLSVEPQRLSSGYLNPGEGGGGPQDAYTYNKSVLETVPYYMAISPVDLDYLDVLWGFDFGYKGNHHELIAEALLGETPLGKLLEANGGGGGAKGINFELSGIVSLSEDARTHARVWIEPRTTPAQVRTGDFSEEMISLYVIVRQWNGGKRLPELHELHGQLIELGEKFVDDHVIGPFLSPIRDAIARRS
ncbi:MAG: hypothetical protein FWD61_17340 [Phycisphaerales bacterium]|nr:hypothetical protein [Phycisphaerales bacterium]